MYEVEKFVSKDFLKPLHYTGPPAERQRLECDFIREFSVDFSLVMIQLVTQMSSKLIGTPV